MPGRPGPSSSETARGSPRPPSPSSGTPQLSTALHDAPNRILSASYEPNRLASVCLLTGSSPVLKICTGEGARGIRTGPTRCRWLPNPAAQLRSVSIPLERSGLTSSVRCMSALTFAGCSCSVTKVQTRWESADLARPSWARAEGPHFTAILSPYLAEAWVSIVRGTNAANRLGRAQCGNHGSGGRPQDSARVPTVSVCNHHLAGHIAGR